LASHAKREIKPPLSSAKRVATNPGCRQFAVTPGALEAPSQFARKQDVAQLRATIGPHGSLATVRGRAGWAWNRVLFYGTAGAAFANVQAAAGAFPFMNSTEPGWTAGVGVEYAFAPNWTAKAEYLFVDLANASCGFANCGGTNTTVSQREHPTRRHKLQIRRRVVVA
jgi:opacity protein-like surface antigen